MDHLPLRQDPTRAPPEPTETGEAVFSKEWNKTFLRRLSYRGRHVAQTSTIPLPFAAQMLRTPRPSQKTYNNRTGIINTLSCDLVNTGSAPRGLQCSWMSLLPAVQPVSFPTHSQPCYPPLKMGTLTPTSEGRTEGEMTR